VIANISRGGGFRGALEYVFGKSKEGQDRAVLIGGTMMGRNPRELAAEFGELRALNSGCKNPVKHVAFALPPGENITDSQAVEVCRRKAQLEGWDTFCVVRHTDEPHAHWHMIGSRITQDGRIMREASWEYERTQNLCREMEQEYGLRGVENTPGIRSHRTRTETKEITWNERQMVERTGEKSLKQQLQDLVEKAAKTATSPEHFVAVLEASSVQVDLNRRGDKITGASFRMGDFAAKGSALGKAFTWGSLAQQIEGNKPKAKKEKAHGPRTRNRAEPEALDLTWADGLTPDSVALDGRRGRGRKGQDLAGVRVLGEADPAAPAPGSGALGGPDAPGAGADPRADVMGGGLGAGASLPVPGAVEPPGPPILAAPAPAGAVGGPELAAPGQQPRGPVREALDLERVYARAEDVQAFARELGTGLKRELWNRDDLDEATVEALRTAGSPIFIQPREGYDTLFDPEGNEAYRFVGQSPKTMPSAIEDLAWTIHEPEAEPMLAEELTRVAYGYEEKPEAYYARPWVNRQADLMQDSLRIVAAQTEVLQVAAEHQVGEHVPRLWDKLRNMMTAVSRWGHDLVATWSLIREVRKAEKDLAIYLGRPVRSQPLPRDPQELQGILEERQKALLAVRDARKREDHPGGPRGSSTGPSKGIRR